MTRKAVVPVVNETPENAPAPDKQKRQRRLMAKILLENSDLKHQYILVVAANKVAGIYSLDNDTGSISDISDSKMMVAAGEHIYRKNKSTLVTLAVFRLEPATADGRFHTPFELEQVFNTAFAAFRDAVVRHLTPKSS